MEKIKKVWQGRRMLLLSICLIVMAFSSVNTFEYFHPIVQREIERPIYDMSGLKSRTDLRALRMTPLKVRKADFRGKTPQLLKCLFDTLTPWPDGRMPEDFNPDEIIQKASDPGLGIRELHRQGINGKDIKVAIIDFPFLQEHEEYKEKVVDFRLTNGNNLDTIKKPATHGTALASLLVGETCGVAPGAKLYFWGTDTKPDYSGEIAALKDILDFNQGKELKERIRIATISKGLNKDYKKFKTFKKVLKKAHANGLTVIRVFDWLRGAGCHIERDRSKPTNYDVWYYFEGYENELESGNFYVPCDYRTTASESGPCEYTYNGFAGLSFGVAYFSGVAALGLQVKPELKPDEIIELIRSTGTNFNRGKLINPSAFIRVLQNNNNKTIGS